MGQRGTMALLADRNFGGMFVGRLAATTGVWMHSVAAVIVVYAATGSSLPVGLVTFAQFAPQMLALWSGM